MGNKWYLFLSRITFISNILFMLSLLLRYTHLVLPEAVTGFVLVIGWAPVSPLLNLVTFVWLVVLLLQRERGKAPLWLLSSNALFFFIQSIYFIAVY
jgi:hypothetical protein